MKNYTTQLKKIRQAAGCEFERQGKGSHEIWWNPETNIRFPVQHKIKSRHMANKVLKEAGLPKEF